MVLNIFCRTSIGSFAHSTLLLAHSALHASSELHGRFEVGLVPIFVCVAPVVEGVPRGFVAGGGGSGGFITCSPVALVAQASGCSLQYCARNSAEERIGESFGGSGGVLLPALTPLGLVGLPGLSSGRGVFGFVIGFDSANALHSAWWVVSLQ